MIMVVALSSVPGYFSAASSDGDVVVPKSRMPLLDASRVLLTTLNSTFRVSMMHVGSTVVALTGILGRCAQLEVSEKPNGPIFRRYRADQHDPTSVLASS
jgi:hypothetical protein